MWVIGDKIKDYNNGWVSLACVLYHSIFLRCQIKYITRHMVVLKWVAPRICCVENKIFYEYKKVFLSDANMNRYI